MKTKLDILEEIHDALLTELVNGEFLVNLLKKDKPNGIITTGSAKVQGKVVPTYETISQQIEKVEKKNKQIKTELEVSEEMIKKEKEDKA